MQDIASGGVLHPATGPARHGANCPVPLAALAAADGPTPESFPAG